MVDKRAGEKIVIDIFTALLGVLSICALTGAVFKIMLAPPKVWDDDVWQPKEIEGSEEYGEPRQTRPHIWME
jgi:hypothetical protein